ncbi:MAG TPA: hypothetical protein PK690_12050, partial [Emcibacteraceae bacterium]|nr:hypothetical protein [Emcibacteraceae bacterium]
MSEPINPEFTAIGVISTSLRILKEKISFFGKLIAAYVILGALPTLILYNGVDFTNPAEIMEIVLKGNPFYIVLN